MPHSLLAPALLVLFATPSIAQITLVQSTPAETGATMTLEVSGAIPGSPIYWLGTSPLFAAPLSAGMPGMPVGAGARKFVPLGTANGLGGLTVGVPIPALSSLLGLVLPMRAIDLQAVQAMNGGLSNRLAAWIGAHPVHGSPAPELFGGYGWSVALGDFLGTSDLDVAVAAVQESLPGAYGAGRVHVYEGPGFTSVTTLTSPSPQAGANFGWSLAALDWNGDGATDLAVGEPGRDGLSPFVDIGAVNVFYHPVGSGGVVVYGDATPVAYEGLGSALAAAQLDLTPNDELVVGAPFPAGSQPASVLATVKLLTYASGSATLLEICEPNLADGLFGISLAAGDVDGDGFDEILVGEPYHHEPNGAFNAGAVHLIDGGVVTLSLIDDTPAVFENFGTSVAIGDLDGDGLGDLLVGVLNENQAQLYLAPTFASATPIVLAPGHPGDQGGGRAVAIADVNGDGWLDALLAASNCSAPGFGVVCGSVTAHLGPALEATAYVADEDLLPRSLACGDVDGDGRDEVAVGYPGASPGFVSGAGCFLLSR